MRHLGGVAVVVVALLAALPARADDGPQRFRLLVPDEAFVFIGRERMKSVGDDRLFVSPPLRAGMQYTYEFTVIHEGRVVAREVRFEPGVTIEVDFRKEFEKGATLAQPFKPLRPEWLPRRVWRA